MSDDWSSCPSFVYKHSDRAGKRALEVSEYGSSHELCILRRKRSINYRLGEDLDDMIQHHVSDTCLNKDDLRFKLMQKNMSRTSQNSDSRSSVDLRYKLRRMPQSSVRNNTRRLAEATVHTQYVVPEPGDTGMTRQTIFEPKDTVVLARIPSSRNTSDMFNTGRNYTSSTVDNWRRRSPERILQPVATRGLSLERSMEERQRLLVRAYGGERCSAY